MSRVLRRGAAALAVALVASGARVAAQGAPAPGGGAAAPAASGGDGTVYVGTYARNILVLDEATMRVIDSIPLPIGIPLGMSPSQDRKRAYVLDAGFEKVAVVDLVGRKVTDTFTLSSGATKVRISGLSVDPRERFAVMLIKAATKKIDRYEIGKPTLVKYDLTRHVVTDTIAWPKGEEREGAQILYSTNGDLLYFFTTDDVLVYDTQTLKQVDRWELSRTLYEEGMGRLNFFFGQSFYEEPGFFTNMFRVTDPVNRRTLMGVARVDLDRRSVDFYTLGPSQPVGFTLAPGRHRAYGLRQEVGNYQVWTFDLDNRRVLRKTEFKGRPRMGLTASTNGRMLYIHTAGATIDVHDADTFELQRTVRLPADMTGLLLVPKG